MRAVGVANWQPLTFQVNKLRAIRDSNPIVDFAGGIGVLDPRGLILLTCGIWGNVIRLLYPLPTPDAVSGQGLKIGRGDSGSVRSRGE
jgi:hypothetical protein